MGVVSETLRHCYSTTLDIVAASALYIPQQTAPLRYVDICSTVTIAVVAPCPLLQ